MRKGSLIDDVEPTFASYIGPAVLFSNAEIRTMMKLAKITKSDVFYDLGSGHGQNLIMALTEFNAKKVVGFENNRKRRKKSIERLEKWSKARSDIEKERWQVLHYDFHKLLYGKIKKQIASVEEATVLFYGLESGADFSRRIAKGWENTTGPKKRLVYYRNCLIPEIMPDRFDEPFFVSEFPFKPTIDKLEWLKFMTGKTVSSLVKGGQPSETELWDDLRHDWGIERSDDDLSYTRSRLSQAVRKNTRNFQI
jgi:hypothetical protein